jgi:hypothetical protein
MTGKMLEMVIKFYDRQTFSNISDHFGSEPSPTLAQPMGQGRPDKGDSVSHMIYSIQN